MNISDFNKEELFHIRKDVQDKVFTPYKEIDLIGYSKKFIIGDVNPDIFVEEYVLMNRKSRYNTYLTILSGKDSEDSLGDIEEDQIRASNKSEAAGSIFCAADMYNPEEDRDEDEIDAEQLKAKVIELLKEGGYL